MTRLQPGQSALLAAEVSRVLAAAGRACVVIGAMAAAVHGVVRASLDADLLVAGTPASAAQLAELLRSAGLAAEVRHGDADDPIGALILVTDPAGNRVDLLIGLRGTSRGTFDRAIPVRLHAGELQVVGLEDFVAMKAFAGGPIDLLDAQRALEIAGDGIDLALLRRIAGTYGAPVAAAVERLLGAVAPER